MKNIELTNEVMSMLEGVYSPINKAHGIVYCVQKLSNSCDEETIECLNIAYFEQQLIELRDLLIIYIDNDLESIDYVVPYSMFKKLSELYKSMNTFLEDTGPDQYDKKLRTAQVMALFGASDFVIEAHTTLSMFVETFYPPAQAA
jgi:hypothetical protein